MPKVKILETKNSTESKEIQTWFFGKTKNIDTILSKLTKDVGQNKIWQQELDWAYH